MPDSTEFQKRAQSTIQTSTMKASGMASIGHREQGFAARFRGDGSTVVGGDFTVDSITLSVSTLALLKDVPAQLTAQAFAADGSVLADQPDTWASDDEGVATVDSSGVVTAVAVGTCNITASIGDVDSGACAVTVTAVFTALTLADATLTFAHTTTGTTTVTAQDQFDADMSLPSGVAVHSSDETKATVALVTDTITVTGVAAGATNVTATKSGVTSNTCAVTLS